MKSKPNEAFPEFSENECSCFVMAIKKFKFENRTSDREFFLPIGRDDSQQRSLAKEGLADLCDMDVYPTNWCWW